MIRRVLCAIAFLGFLNGTAQAASDADAWKPSKKVAPLCEDYSAALSLSITAKTNGKSEDATLESMLYGMNEDYSRVRREAVRVAYEVPAAKGDCMQFLKPYDIAEQAGYQKLFGRRWICPSGRYAFNMEGRVGFAPNTYPAVWENGQYYVEGNQLRLKLWWQPDKYTQKSSVENHTFNRVSEHTLQIDGMSCRNDL